MSHESCPGYAVAPFAGLVAAYPGEDVYSAGDFRVEWGPIFHRGRLDGSARVLVLGQDPATHESIARRILVGEAGQRVQGLLAKVGIGRSYVLVNTFLYSVFGQGGGQRHAKDPAIAAYRNAWLDALLVGSQVSAVVTLGQLAHTAYDMWAATQPGAAAGLHLAAIRHPTYPESSARASGKKLSETTAILLEDWNRALPALAAHVTPEGPVDTTPYAVQSGWRAGDLAPIPEVDLPAGSPPWWLDLRSWATRTGEDAQAKRATIQVTVPRAYRAWPPLG